MPKLLVVLFLLFTPLVAPAADWNQWRGSSRDGSTQGPPLVDSLPETGVAPLWRSEPLPAADNGGWSSPVIEGGKLYLFAHKKTKVGDSDLGPTQFPWLPTDKRGGMSAEEYEQYEVNRRDEQERRAKNFRYDETVYCLDALTGKQLWANEEKSFYTRFPQSTTPVVGDGRLYVAGAARVIRCLDAKSGETLWTVRLPGPFRDEIMQASPLLVDGLVVVSVGALYALDAQTGEIRWRFDTESDKASHSSPVAWRHADQTYVIACLADGETVCLDLLTGAKKWQVDTMSSGSTPIVLGDTLLTYGSSRKGGLRRYDLSPTGLELRWNYQRSADPGSSPVVVGDYVYVQGEKRLACVNLESGEAEWSTTLDRERPRYTSPIAGAGKVFYTFESILCFDATPEDFTPFYDGKLSKDGVLATEEAYRKKLNLDELEKTAEGQKEAERLRREVFEKSEPLACASPALVDGRLYLRLRDRIICFDLRRP
ncbi:PQQ-binding-like beta-propeller repeat protein [Lignipirellula cremea]|uniref:Serine/threonine-protein kinase AfsK n=1 Tax=Lignipirellula cremea TaxID=2528010 RepID=A0A518DQY7_9BACT|nr:PQQ-binding-like beta-propeller repeat protein [Lignipirellula cremea]QDU94232.1 Serine/threonine-protein kinase AfsK [Lignipirellula cremea]